MEETKCMGNCWKLYWQGKQEGIKIGKGNRDIQCLFFISPKCEIHVINTKTDSFPYYNRKIPGKGDLW